MGRRPHRKSLALWSNGQRVGVWHLGPGGVSELQYEQRWIDAPEGRPLSLSLPFTIGNLPHKGERVLNYFDNLLPDNPEIRKRLASQFKTGSTEAFELLTALGRDCVGAIQLLEEGTQPEGFDRIEGTPMTDAGIEQYLLRTVASPAVLGQEELQEDDFRISLAGAQEKTALLWHENRWLRPHGATPTTHIFKLPLGMVGPGQLIDLRTSVENEWLCSRILAAYDIPVASSRIMDFGQQRVLVVERFDRRLHSSGHWWLRLPQEDFCQVKNVPPDFKYEDKGGPGILDICATLQQSENAARDLRTFMSAQILFWMLGATDGHAKNFSIQLQAQGRFHLTPLYDVLSIWPVVGGAAHNIQWQKAKMAMAVRGKNRHYHLKEIQRRHYNAMAPQCGLGADAEELLEFILERTPQVIATVSAELPAGFPQHVAASILGGLEQAALQLAAMPPH